MLATTANPQIHKRSDGYFEYWFPHSGMKRIRRDQIARTGQAISSPVRLRALNLWARRPWRVEELARTLDESVAATNRSSQSAPSGWHDS